MKAVLEEFNANAAAVNRYIDALQGLLIGLYDADVWEMSEWDWQWPAHPAPAIQQAQLQAAATQLNPSTVETLQAVYAAYARPPALAGWAEHWDGSEALFLRFMHERLEEYRAAARARFDAARRALHELR